MKKLVINIELIVIAFAIYFLQSNFFNWFTISGIMPNLFVIYILFIGLFSNATMPVLYGIVLGIILDFSIGTNLGIYAVVYGIIGLLAAIFDKNFSKDSRATIMFMVMGATFLFETIVYILNFVIFGINLEIVNFIRILAIEIIYNLIISIIIYPLIKKFGYYIENIYNTNKILTKYF